MHCFYKTSLLLIISSVIIGTYLEELTDHEIGHPVVNTKLGPVRGKTMEVLNSSLHVFHGIPFAKPPVGQLRFKHPVPADSWNGTLDGTRHRNACFQVGTSKSWTLRVRESEDCLYLNIYVPGTSTPMNGSSLNRIGMSVMFYIYGGGFIRGTATTEIYNGSMLAVTNDVIVVTTEYRLAAFGYLFSSSPEAPGNAGLLDQLMALQWVHDNIESFGGDPGSVTIFGESAGSFSVGFLLVLPQSRNLFHRAILMSGTPIVYDALLTSVDDSFTIIEKLSNFTNCNPNCNSTINEIMICLKNISAELLDRAQESFTGHYRPSIDEHFLPDRVENLYEEIIRKNISIILGVTRDEGSMFVPPALKYEFSKSENLTVSYSGLLDDIINPILKDNHLSVIQKIMVHYLYSNWEDIHDGKANLQLASDFLSDISFVCPANEFGHQLSDRNLDVYYFKFDHRPSNTLWPVWEGVAHGDDVSFVFGHPLLPNDEYTKEESLISYRIMKAFGNFAKFGVPSYEGVVWPKYSRESQTFVSIKSDGDTIKKGPRANHCALWNDLLPKLKIDKEMIVNEEIRAFLNMTMSSEQ